MGVALLLTEEDPADPCLVWTLAQLPVVCAPVFSQNELPFPLLYSADLVVGLTSMLITEAALLRTPTLSILPRKGEDAWLPTIAWGLTESAYSPRQIRQLLTKLLTGSHPSIFPKIIPNNCLTTVVNLIELLLRHEKPQAI